MSNRKRRFSKSVFINCPFDEDYVPLLRPLLFTVLYCGYEPRIATESFDSGATRINKIFRLISESKFSIHDLSRSQSKEANELYRMNMPFELGIDIGCRKFGQSPKRQKRCLVLDEEKYRYQKVLSDLSGSDIKHHEKRPDNIVFQVRNWFVENGHIRTPSGGTIWDAFNEFMTDFYQKREKEGFSDKDLQMMPVPEMISFMQEWIALTRKS